MTATRRNDDKFADCSSGICNWIQPFCLLLCVNVYATTARAVKAIIIEFNGLRFANSFKLFPLPNSFVFVDDGCSN